MVNPQRPDDHEHFTSEEPDVEGHGSPEDETPDDDTEGHIAIFAPPADGDEDTEGHIAL